MEELLDTDPLFFFICCIQGYCINYGKKSTSNPRKHNYGHARDLGDAHKHREEWIRTIQNANKKFTLDELERAKKQALDTFNFQGISKSEPEFERSNIEELLNEAIAIAQGDLGKVKGVCKRFGIKPAPEPARAGRQWRLNEIFGL